MFKKILLSSVAIAFLIAPLKAQQAVPGATAASTQPQTVSGTVTANQGLPPWAQNLTQLNGVALGSPTSPGVTPSGNLIGVNTVFSNSLLGGTNFIGFTGNNPFVSGTGVSALSSSSGVVANATATATLLAAVGKTTYITGFEVTANGATAASCSGFNVTGTLGGSLSYVFCWPAGATLPATPLVVTFNPPLPAATTNTQIVVTVPAAGAGNTGTAVNARGFQQ